jgi:hypothetical protein
MTIFGGSNGADFAKCATKCGTIFPDTWTWAYGHAPSLVTSVAVSRVSDAQVTISWQAPATWGSSSADLYEIDASTPNVDGVSRWNLPATAATATLGALYDGVPVNFTVTAHNSGGLSGGLSAPSPSADPSPTSEVSNTLTFSTKPSALSGSSCHCFTLQQNFFVEQVNAGPGAVPTIWAQNVVYAYEESGAWYAASVTNVWNLGSAGFVYWGVGTTAVELASFPSSLSVTTAVRPGSIVFSSSLAGTAYWTWDVPSLADSDSYDVVYNPDDSATAEHVFFSPQGLLVGPGNGAAVNFLSGTEGSLQSAEVLGNGSTQAGYVCPITDEQASTAEAGKNLAWSVTGAKAAFKYSKGSSFEGVAFLPEDLPCGASPASQAFNLQVRPKQIASRLLHNDGEGQ